MAEGDEDVGEHDDGVGVDCGDDDGPGGVPAPPGERGRGGPPSSSLTFPLDGRRVYPLVHGGGGDLDHPMPWRPWTRGETLLPSREKVKEEEEGGTLPLSSGGVGTPPGQSSCDGDLLQQLCHLHQHLHHLPPSIYSGPLSRNPLYPLLKHGALCFILLSNDVLPSYDVLVDFCCPVGNW